MRPLPYYIFAPEQVKKARLGRLEFNQTESGSMANSKVTGSSEIQSPAAGEQDPSAVNRAKLVILAVVVLIVGGIIALQFLRPEKAAAKDKPVTTTAPVALNFNQFRGICLQVQSGEENYPFDKYIKEIAATGANSICMSVAAFQQNAGSSSIFIENRKVPSSKRLKELINLAHEQGLRVILMPIVLLENPREGEWRGKIDPTKDKNTWDDWWERYTNYILHYAQLAEESKVDVFMVGSELVSTEGQTERWVKLIDEVRRKYHGLLSYSSNWDHYKPVKFWDKLDIIGMTTYYDLTDDKKPTLDVLMASWVSIKKEILDWQATIGRPLLFTEVGWPNQETAAKYPWDYYRSTDKPDPQQQKLCFESFFKTWTPEPAMGGYLIWEWRNYEGQVTDPVKGTDYCPKDKPAMELISQYFRLPNGNGNATSLPAVAPATNKAYEQTPTLDAGE